MVYFALQVILLWLLFFTLLPCRKMSLIPLSITLLLCSLTKYAVCIGKYLNGIIWVFNIVIIIIILLLLLLLLLFNYHCYWINLFREIRSIQPESKVFFFDTFTKIVIFVKSNKSLLSTRIIYLHCCSSMSAISLFRWKIVWISLTLTGLFSFFLVPLAFQKQRSDFYVWFDLALKILNERYKQ